MVESLTLVCPAKEVEYWVPGEALGQVGNGVYACSGWQVGRVRGGY